MKKLTQEDTDDLFTALIGVAIFITGMIMLHPAYNGISFGFANVGFFGLCLIFAGLFFAICTILFLPDIRKILKELREESTDEDEEWKRKHEFKYAG